MTKGALENKKLDQEKELKEAELEEKKADREQRAHDNKMGRVVDLVTSPMRMFRFNPLQSKKKNDPVFYKQYPINLEKFVNVPTFHRLGQEFWAKLSLAKDEDGNTYKLPGIIIFDIVSSVGPTSYTNIASDPINNGLARLKSQVLKSNSRSQVTWEPSDLGLNILCTADIMEKMCEVGKALKIFYKYQATNAYLAQTLIEALGFSYSDLLVNIADYRKVYEELVARFNTSIVAPSSVTLFARKYYLGANVFVDGVNEHSRQMFAYRLRTMQILNAAGDGTVTYNFSSVDSMSTVLSKIREAIVSIVDNPDYQEMYNDLRNAFADLITLPSMISDKEGFVFNSFEGNREQIHNTVTLPHTGNSVDFTYDSECFEFHQDHSGYLYQGTPDLTKPNRGVSIDASSYTATQFASLMGATAYYYDKNNTYGYLQQHQPNNIFDMYKDEITGDDILDVTRFNMSGVVKHEEGTQKFTLSIYNCGTEICIDAHIYVVDGTNHVVRAYLSTCIIESDNPYNYLVPAYHQFVASMISKFDWAPSVTFININTSDSTWPIRSLYNISDLEHPFVINDADMQNINMACVLSEFYVSDNAFKR